jgi:Carboxypeptidase regulatory-like domain
VKLRATDAVLTQQAFITGQVEDALTNQPTLNPATVELFYQTPDGEPARSYPLTAQVSRSGLFVFAGDPSTALPRILPGETLDLRLTASAKGYQTLSIDVSLSAASLALTEQVRQIDGRDVTLALLDAPLLKQHMALSPEPVHLSGRVVQADNPEVPIPSAQVHVTQPDSRGPVTTDQDGFFTLLNLPVALEVTVSVAQAGFNPLVQTIVLDYRQPVNQRTFALSS